MDHIGVRPLDGLEPQHLHNFGANEVVGAPWVHQDQHRLEPDPPFDFHVLPIVEPIVQVINMVTCKFDFRI